MKIPITFLGTSQAVPTAKRNHTAVLIQYSGENILVDCGEGTQRQFRKAHINPCKLTRILITHWHGDHVLGIPGLIQTLGLNGYNKTLHIYGPKGTKRFMKELTKFFVLVGRIKIEVHEATKGKVFETSDFVVKAIPMKHGPPSNAYSITEKTKNRLDKQKIKKLKLPGKLLAKLSQGKNVKHKGKTINAKQISYKTLPKKIAIIMDTKINPNCQKIAKNADLIISEATYLDKDKALASKHKHLTAEQAAETAAKAKAKQLILTHISQRNDLKENIIIKEAKRKFKNTKLAHDLMQVEI